MLDQGFFSQIGSYQKTLEKGINNFLAWRIEQKGQLREQAASLLVVSFGKALNGMHPSLCGKQMMGPSSLPVVVAQLSKNKQTEHDLIRMNE